VPELAFEIGNIRSDLLYGQLWMRKVFEERYLGVEKFSSKANGSMLRNFGWNIGSSIGLGNDFGSEGVGNMLDGFRTTLSRASCSERRILAS
jgi:hypothetical protein